MLDSVALQEEGTVSLASIYGAALARSRSNDADESDMMSATTMTEEFDLRVLPLALAANANAAVSAGDWDATIGLVERAAATIKAYERRFVQLDVHTRALIERSAEESARLHAEVRALEQRLQDSEERAARAEMATRDEAFYRWEAERRLREVEDRLAESEDHSRQTEDYLRRVHSALADL